MIPIVDSTKRGIESNEGSRESGGNFRYYPDGKRNKKINAAVILRITATGFNSCPDEKRSETRIACAICKMSRDVSTIVPRIKGIGNKVIIASHYILFFAVAPTQKGQKADPQTNNDNIVHLVSIVSQ